MKRIFALIPILAATALFPLLLAAGEASTGEAGAGEEGPTAAPTPPAAATGAAQGPTAAPDAALEPLALVTKNTERVLAILRDPALAGEDKRKERLHDLYEAIADNFDWEAIARSALGRHWRGRSAEDLAEFTGLFRSLLEHIYYRRLDQHAVSAAVSYDRETIDGDYAEVSCRAVKSGVETPIVFLLHRAGTADPAGGANAAKARPWLVYDIKVEGVSLLLNYREQFNEIVVGSDFDALMEKLRAKVATETGGEE